MKKSVTVVPSYPAESFEALRSLADDILDVTSELQVDIVDGKFVSAISWPFNQKEMFVDEALCKLATFPIKLALEFDCMVMEPQQYFDIFVELGAARVVVHYGSTDDYGYCLEHAHQHGYKIGLAVLPTVRLGEVEKLIEKFEYVQVMGIAEVGKQGQPFSVESLNLIKAIKTHFPEKEIAVDGAVNADTIPRLVAAGATRLAPGSAIVKAEDRAGAYQALFALANS